MSSKNTYFFGNGEADGSAELKNILGGKGANLAEMTRIGLPVPAGFTISTDVCSEFYLNEQKLPESCLKEINEQITKLENVMGAEFGDTENPLLLSVRSGARVSMPGMMDTVLNLGLNSDAVSGLASKTGDERFAWDSYRRFIQMYSNVVMGISSSHLENEIEFLKEDNQYQSDTEITASQWQEICKRFKKIILDQTGKRFPEDPKTQLIGSIEAVFRSWRNPRANVYRKLNNIPEHWGTAVNVQAMVFGNMGDDCCTGVAFTRDPSNGEKNFFGEFLINAQGEDVVAGVRTPHPINNSSKSNESENLSTLEEVMPKVYSELHETQVKLETHYKDMQDIEFTVQKGKLFILQTRSGKRTAHAALKIAVEMQKEGLITKEDAVKRIDPGALDQLLHPMIDPNAKKKVLTKGLPASPGAACGRVVFSPEEAERKVKTDNEKVILVRIETSPEDIAGMHVSEGILTARGGMTSHAAVVARGMGKCCVAGCSTLKISEERKEFQVGAEIIKEGDWITLDGVTGEVILGKVPTVTPTGNEHFATLMSWADEFRTLKVRANADTPHDADIAREFGAEGIGLCRTEHMFFEKNRIELVRKMILSETSDARKEALDALLPIQKEDFTGIFKSMTGFAVTIRLLDPPLHEFLPNKKEEIKELSESMGVSLEALERKVDSLHEFNPMLGHRGCRLGLSHPEIYDMQVRAILEASMSVEKETGKSCEVEIMIPLVGHVNELKFIRKRILGIAESLRENKGSLSEFHIGTMIELPRAALTADEIAEEADFFSFGTNDLTQTTFGLSRDDAGGFLSNYVDHLKILHRDPFQSIDEKGVGKLVEIAKELGRQAKPNIKLGICGEHGGDPESIEFFNKVGLDYVSCSPYRIPVARLAAAQSALKKLR